VRDLLSKSLVEPLGEGESSGGRPPDMIRFKAERGCLLAVEISAERLSFLLTDLNGSKIAEQTLSLLNQETTPAAICTYIGDELKSLLKKQKKTRAQLLALVVGVPAITNVEEGSVLSISTLEGWRSVPLRDLLGKITKCLVIVENDTNLAAQGEQYCGAARTETDFIYINIGTNVGAGIFLKGGIHHGSQWSAGEIAYLRLPSISRGQLTIHEFGELETVVTTSGILKRWQAETGEAAQNGTGAHNDMDAPGILRLAQSGDARAVRIIEYWAEIVADIIVNLSLILNPGLILLGGEVGGHAVVIEFLRKQLEGSEFAVTKIASGELGDRAVLLGGISLALDALPSVLLPQPSL
jgi:glucokinase